MAESRAIMPTGTVDVEVRGDTRAVEQMVQDLASALQPDDLARFLREDVHTIMEMRTRGRFATEGDDVSGPWAELRPYTQEERRRGGFGAAHPINVRTGQMREHLLSRTTDAEPNNLGATMWFPKRGGSTLNLKKVQAAQVGLDKPKTPARPVLGVNENDMELVLVAIGKHLARYQRGAGGLFR